MEVTNPNPPTGGGLSYDTMYDAGNTGAGITINWSTNGRLQKAAINQNTTLTFTAPAGGCSLKLKLTNGGAYTCALPATVIWAQGVEPVITPTASAVDIVALYYDGTDYYGSIIQNAS